MRISSVSQCESLGRAQEPVPARSIGVLLAEVRANSCVVLRCHIERLERKTAPKRHADIAVTLRPRLDEVGVISGIGEYSNALVVLRCGAQQRDTTDVDLLDCVCERAAWPCDGRCERVEIADDDGDRRDGLCG